MVSHLVGPGPLVVLWITARAPFNNSAPRMVGGGDITPGPPPPKKNWAKFSSGPSAIKKVLAPSTPISLDEKILFRASEPQPHRGEGGGGGAGPPTPSSKEP